MQIHLLFATVATCCATTIAASTPVAFASDDGRSNNQQRRIRNKYSKKDNKKQSIKKEETCTMDDFVGDYKYLNCEGVETKVDITCAAAADDDGTAENTAQCEYKEHPLNDDAANLCVFQGSFDPITQITMDSARAGVCQLEFVPLTDSCANNVSPTGFGMKAEVDLTTGHDTTSTLLLRFSTDGGAVYYNEEEPRVTVFLHDDFPPGRKLKDCRYKSIQICDPMMTWSDGCEDNDCANDVWKDGCLGCMCYNQGNGSWCDGIQSDYYDNYFEENGENPFGDSNRSNRKCNTIFAPYGVLCEHNWECESGLDCKVGGPSRLCLYSSSGSDLYCDPMKGSSYDGCRDWDCASDRWEDGCLGCMCYNRGIDAWCDGTQSAYYDNYFEEHGMNPFGDSNHSNRKCNTNFSPTGASCKWNWECEDYDECFFYDFFYPTQYCKKV